ncbi:MAG: hypothetical protein WD557_05790 [Dehalococcoidia bacterium]
MPLSLAFSDALTATDLRVYAAIDYRCGKSGEWYGRQSEIRELIGERRVAPRTVRESVDKLRELGFILTKRLGADKSTVLLYAIPARVTGGISPLAPTGEKPPLPPAKNRQSDRRKTAAPETQTTNTDHNTESLSRCPSKFAEAWTAATAAEPSKEVTARIALTLSEGTEESWILDAIRETGRKGKGSWAYTAGILANWKRDGRDAPRERPQANRRNGRTPGIEGLDAYGVNARVREALDPLAAARAAGRVIGG